MEAAPVMSFTSATTSKLAFLPLLLVLLSEPTALSLRPDAPVALDLIDIMDDLRLGMTCAVVSPSLSVPAVCRRASTGASSMSLSVSSFVFFSRTERSSLLEAGSVSTDDMVDVEDMEPTELLAVLLAMLDLTPRIFLACIWIAILDTPSFFLTASMRTWISFLRQASEPSCQSVKVTRYKPTRHMNSKYQNAYLILPVSS
mmetsp:Transcript_13698/g.27292  ORF Transcript_13698/g.27292 Transcript_13698/m.27292 type:complete len:201 (-) Transcript_13698:2296-2898(-)